MDDFDDMLADSLRAGEKPAAAPADDDFDAMLDESMAKPVAPPNPSRGTGITTDALPIDETRPINQSMAVEAEALGLPTTAGPSDLAKRAAAAGVVFDKPARAGHALASLAYDDEERRRAFEQSLSAEYGRPVIVEKGPATGALEYVDPDTNRFALVAPDDMSLMESIPGAAGGSLVMVPELAVGALAAITTRSPFLTSMGGGAGAFLGEASRLLLGQSLGINKDVTVGQIAWEATKAGGLSAGAGVAGDKAVQFVQFLKHAYDGDAVKYAAKAGEKLGISLEDAASLQDQINRTVAAERMRIGARNADLPPNLRAPETENRRFALTLGEATGDPDLLAFQDGLKRSSKYQARFGEFDKERQGALVDFYETIAKPFSRSSVDATTTFGQVQNRAATRLGYDQRRATEHLARYEADAANAMNSVTVYPMHQLGDVARNVGDAEYGAFNGRANELANGLRTMAGGAKFIGNKNTSEAFNSLNDRAKNLIIPALKRDAKKSQMLPPRTHMTESGEVILNKLYDPDSKLTFSQSWDTISRLKEVLRQGGDSDMDTGAIKKIVGAMEEDLYESANQTELGPMYSDFVHWYRREKTRLDQGIVGQILQREGGPGGGFTFASEKAFQAVFPATNARGGLGITPTREFMDLIKNDPQAITAFRGAIGDDWRNYVVRDGRVDQGRHAEWLNMHREQLQSRFPGLAAEERSALGSFGITQPKNAGEALFTPDEMKAIGRAESFEKILQAREEKADRALKSLNETFNTKLTKLEDMGQLMTLVRDDLDGYKAGKLMKFLDGAPDVKRGFQAEYLRDMRERVMTNRHPTTQEPILSPAGLRKFIYGKADAERGQGVVVKQLFGQKYAEDLMTLEKALTQASRETTYPNRSNTSGWATVGALLVRAKFGVISREARVFTSLAMMNRANADRVMAKAIMNPGDMRRLMSIWHSDIRDRKVAAIASQLGFGPAELGPPDEE